MTATIDTAAAIAEARRLTRIADQADTVVSLAVQMRDAAERDAADARRVAFLTVPCPDCGTEPGEACPVGISDGIPQVGVHGARIAASGYYAEDTQRDPGGHA